MELIESIDPIIMQLLIVPFVVIGLGVGLAAFTKKFVAGPILTLILTLSYNVWYFSHFYPSTELTFTMISAWCLIFPLFSLYLSWLAVERPGLIKQSAFFKSKQKKAS